MMRALITGIGGFVGSHLAEHLLDRGADVCGIDIGCHAAGLPWPGRRPEVFIGDVCDETFLGDAIRRAQPTHVFHMAGVLGGAPGGALVQYEINVLGTVRLLETVRRLLRVECILVNSSSAVYGACGNSAITETASLHPMTAYAASKASQEMVCLHYFLEYALPIVRARTFNLLGPRQTPSLVTSSIARHVAVAERGGPRAVHVGDLTPKRDYTDVRDAVRAYGFLAEKGERGEVYNVCSGSAWCIQEIADSLLRMSAVPLTLDPDPQRMRAVDILEQVGSAKRLRTATGWDPVIPLNQSLHDLLEYWRGHLERQDAG